MQKDSKQVATAKSSVDSQYGESDKMPNQTIRQIKKDLVCPRHRTPLRYNEDFLTIEGPWWPDGKISCPEGCAWTIRGGIPRFVEDASYASSFGVQWNKYPRIELDSVTGKSYSRQRLERCLG